MWTPSPPARLTSPDLTFLSTNNSDSFIQGSTAIVLVGSNSAFYDVYTGITGPKPFGSGTDVANSDSATHFGISSRNNEIAVPTGYVSGTPINGSAIFSGKTLSTLGLRPGTYVYTLPSSTVTVQIGPVAAVPEPGSLALLTGMGLSGAGFLARRRKKRPQSRLDATHREASRPNRDNSPVRPVFVPISNYLGTGRGKSVRLA